MVSHPDTHDARRVSEVYDYIVARVRAARGEFGVE